MAQYSLLGCDFCVLSFEHEPLTLLELIQYGLALGRHVIEVERCAVVVVSLLHVLVHIKLLLRDLLRLECFVGMFEHFDLFVKVNQQVSIGWAETLKKKGIDFRVRIVTYLVEPECSLYELTLINHARASVEHLQLLEDRFQNFAYLIRESLDVDVVVGDEPVPISSENREDVDQLPNQLLLHHLLALAVSLLLP